MAKGVLTRLPYPVQLSVVEQYSKAKVRRFDELRTPTSLIYFITNRCNERCDHCFYWRDLNTHMSELTLDEIEPMVRSLSVPATISFTGGEPFIRKDIAQIARLFDRINHAPVLGISSNATLADRTIGGILDILDNCSFEQLQLQVSLDGLQETHDRIRRVPRAFSRTMDVLREIVEIRKSYPQFRPSINFCVQRDNIDEIEPFVATMRPFGIPIRFAVVRGNSYGTYDLDPEVAAGVDPKDSGTNDLSLEQLEAAFRLVDELDRGAQGGFWTDIERLKIRTTLNMIRTGQRQVPCYNGRTEGVIYPNGEFSMCEMTRSIGNLRDYDLDVAKIWKSEAAQAMRGPISKCSCIHGCSLVTSIGLQPEILLKKILDQPMLSS